MSDWKGFDESQIEAQKKELWKEMDNLKTGKDLSDLICAKNAKIKELIAIIGKKDEAINRFMQKYFDPMDAYPGDEEFFKRAMEAKHATAGE